MGTTIVFAGGPVTGATTLPSSIGPFDLVVAADSGLERAIALEVPVDVVVGDLDSVDPAVLRAAEAGGVRIERHPVDKDATDLELALQVACTAGTDRLVVVGSAGGRLDHLLASLSVLAHGRLAGIEVDASFDGTHVLMVRERRRELPATVGDLISLLPIGGAACGVHTEGLRWELSGEVLEANTARGVSNEVVSAPASVHVERGCVAAVLPPNDSDDQEGAR